MSNIGSSLTEPLGPEATADILVTVGDTGLDAAISSGALDGIPVFGVAIGIWRAGNSVQEELFVRKVIRFLNEANKASPDERRRFIEGLE